MLITTKFLDNKEKECRFMRKASCRKISQHRNLHTSSREIEPNCCEDQSTDNSKIEIALVVFCDVA